MDQTSDNVTAQPLPPPLRKEDVQEVPTTTIEQPPKASVWAVGGLCRLPSGYTFIAIITCLPVARLPTFETPPLPSRTSLSNSTRHRHTPAHSCPRPVGQTWKHHRHHHNLTPRSPHAIANSLSRPPPLIGRDQGDQARAERRGPGLRQHHAHRAVSQGKCVWFWCWYRPPPSYTLVAIATASAGLARRRTRANVRNTTVTVTNQNFPCTLHAIAAAAHVLLAKHHCHHRRHHKPAPRTSDAVAAHQLPFH